MNWSATFSLHTKPSYGSFSSSSSTSLSRSSSGTTIHIPQSIPEHQCVVQFTSPPIHRKEISEIDKLKIRTSPSNSHNTNQNVNGTLTMTMTETNTFKILLTSASNTNVHNNREEQQPLLVKDDSTLSSKEMSHTASSYWLQERERMRIKRNRHYGQEIQLTGWKMAVVLCSVPVLLLIAFLLYTLIHGTENHPPSIDNDIHLSRLRYI